jgi:DNA-binding MltR family transcriptional regulator
MTTITLPPEFSSFLDDFQKESDRAAAVLGAAYLDERLEQLLRSVFVGTPRFVEELLTGQGGLATFSARISIAYATGLITLPVAQDLHLIRRIRNDFAHARTRVTFASVTVAQRVDKIQVLDMLGMGQRQALQSSANTRGKFNAVVALLIFLGVHVRISTSARFKEAEPLIVHWETGGREPSTV